jgi:hypothetical protein
MVSRKKERWKLLASQASELDEPYVNCNANCMAGYTTHKKLGMKETECVTSAFNVREYL